MKIRLTNHCLQRREHHTPQDRSRVLKWSQHFIEIFNIGNLPNSTYKIRHKSSWIVIAKSDNQCVVVTFRGWYYSRSERKKLNLNIIDTAIAQKNKLYRTNFVGRTVHCGSIKNNADGSIRFKFKKDVFEKYDVPSEYRYSNIKGLKFDTLDSVDFLEEKNDKKYITFKRKDTNEI